jgi:phosphate-selective porin OprO and OprP
MGRSREVRSWISVVWLCGILMTSGRGARAQDQGPPPLLPIPEAEARSDQPVQPSTSVEQIAARLRAMEEANKKLAEQLEKANQQHDAQIKQLHAKIGELSNRLSDAEKDATKFDVDAAVTAPSNDANPSAYPDTPVPDYTEGQFFPNSAAPGYPLSNEPGTKRKSVIGSFGPGFQFETPDEEFGLQVHLESQIEARVWGQRDQFPGNSGFFMPRQRIFFNGHITKRVEYEFSINRGLGGTVNILNAFLNLHVDDRFEIKFGRFFTPLTYDQYAISNYWMPTPERSLFTTNVGLGRQVGLMGWGYLFDKRLDYAAVIFNGSRNSFESLNNGVDFVAFLNARPFQESEGLDFLRFLNLGSSVAFGYQDQPPVPVSFRIGGGSPNGDVPGAGTTPFLILNPGVIERGDRLLGSVHSAYYYKSLSLIGEWQYGYGSYASFSHPASTAVPFSGFYFVGGYFLTGEEVERRSRVTPNRPFFPTSKGQERGPGAWEVVGRVSELRLGENIFTSGFADPYLWSNQAVTTELGLNWYLNEYLKMYIFWLHGDFGQPVEYRPGGFQRNADMFWLRCQLYY